MTKRRQKRFKRTAIAKATASQMERSKLYPIAFSAAEAREWSCGSNIVGTEEADFCDRFVGHLNDLHEIASLNPGIPVATFEEVSRRRGVVGGRVKYIHRCIKRFVNDLTMPFEDALLHFQSHVVHPHEACYQNVISRINPFDLKDALLNGNALQKEEGVKALNAVVAAIQEAMRSEEVRNQLSNYRRSTQKCFASLTSIAFRALAKYSRLLSVRVDLAYSRSAVQGTDVHGALTIDEAISHRKQIVKYIAKEFQAGLVVYAWAMECASFTGVHFHFWLLLKGSHHRRDVSLAAKVGEHWARVTEGRGRYFNCNAVKKTYRIRGIGMLLRGSAEALVGLEAVARYITKLDFSLCYKLDRSRTFGRSDQRRIDGQRRTRQLMPKGA